MRNAWNFYSPFEPHIPAPLVVFHSAPASTPWRHPSRCASSWRATTRAATPLGVPCWRAPASSPPAVLALCLSVATRRSVAASLRGAVVRCVVGVAASVRPGHTAVCRGGTGAGGKSAPRSPSWSCVEPPTPPPSLLTLQPAAAVALQPLDSRMCPAGTAMGTPRAKRGRPPPAAPPLTFVAALAVRAPPHPSVAPFLGVGVRGGGGDALLLSRCPPPLAVRAVGGRVHPRAAVAVDAGTRPGRDGHLPGGGGGSAATVRALLPGHVLPPPAPPATEKEAMEAELAYERAKAVEKGGDKAAARAAYEALLASYPSSGRAWMRLALLARADGDTSAQRAVLCRALAALPANAMLWQAAADAAKAAGDLAEARRLFATASEVDPTLPSVYHSWGSLEARAGRPAEARRLFTAGLAVAPSSARLHHALGVLEDKAGRPEAARTVLRAGLALEPANAHLHHAMGMVEYKAGRRAGAVECWRRATDADPHHTPAWLAWGQAEELAGRPDQAAAHYAAGTRWGGRRGRRTAPLWAAAATLEEKRSRPAAADAIYRAATVAHPRDVGLLCSWGKLKASTGDVTAARSIFQRGLAIDRTCAYLWQSLGLLEATAVGPTTAASVYERGVAAARGEGVAALLHAWAALEWKRGNDAAARALFDRAVSADPGAGWIWLWYGQFEAAVGATAAGVAMAAGEAGDAVDAVANAPAGIDPRAYGGWYERAQHYFARAVNADPADASVWRAWAELDRSRGREERARFRFRRAAVLTSEAAFGMAASDYPLARPWTRRALNEWN